MLLQNTFDVMNMHEKKNENRCRQTVLSLNRLKLKPKVLRRHGYKASVSQNRKVTSHLINYLKIFPKDH